MEWFRKFMAGRYGTDQLNLTLLGMVLVLYVFNLFKPSVIVVLICWISLFIYSYRSFSRNIVARGAENVKFQQMLKPLTNWWRGRANRHKDKKTHKYYKCPNCCQKIRVPKGKGKICITCPKCRMEFIKKT